jgi:hypothetical protein
MNDKNIKKILKRILKESVDQSKVDQIVKNLKDSTSQYGWTFGAGTDEDAAINAIKGIPDLETAKITLISSWDAYHLVFQENPMNLTPHPRFGPLNYDEWERFHAKHIDHHLGQFGC